MEYPNLELVAYKAELMLQNDPGFKERFTEATKDSKFKMRPDCEIICFPQTWATTALGFDAPGTMCGQAFTKAYTTVIHECVTDTYLVFFGGRPAYQVTNATNAFYRDLSHRNLKSVMEAGKAY